MAQTKLGQYERELQAESKLFDQFSSKLIRSGILLPEGPLMVKHRELVEDTLALGERLRLVRMELAGLHQP